MRLLLLFLFSASFLAASWAQTGCPGCVVSVPPNLPADTVFLPDLPDGVKGTPYNHDISFRLPKTTTPVHAIDSTTPPDLTISKFEIVSVEGLPPGLYWQLNQSVFDPATQTDGCIKICGTPLESDSFHILVTLKATVFIITQLSSFPMSLYVAPKVSSSDGFSLTNPLGCGPTEVSVTNNVPSNGSPGFSYSWDFGDGSPESTLENPPAHTYAQPGVYELNYRAIVDTAGYTLESIKVEEVECSDPPLFGNPDLFLEIRYPDGNIAFNSSPAINSTTLPYTFPINMSLQPGNYTLQVWDDDSGIKGSDDDCGVLTFNLLSDGSLVAGGLKVEMNILHPIDTILSKDTVTVFPQPADPQIHAPNGLVVCEDVTAFSISSSYGFGNQWMLNGNLIAGATDFIYLPKESGFYQVRYISPDGCVATSDSAAVVINPLPAEPIWFNYNNSLRLANPAVLPAHYALQWYNGVNPIPGETDIWYCSLTSGTYTLVLTDLDTGCSSSFSNTVTHNPNFDCTVGTQTPEQQTLALYPNPTDGSLHISLNASPQAGSVLKVWDVSGKCLVEYPLSAGAREYNLDLGGLNPGLYLVGAPGVGYARVIRE